MVNNLPIIKPNWPTMIESIGLSHAELVARLGEAGIVISRSAITLLAQGVTREPRWTVGQGLLDIAAHGAVRPHIGGGDEIRQLSAKQARR